MGSSVEEKVVLTDLASFITWCVETDHEFFWTLANVSHDCNGLITKESGFSPRTFGFRSILHRSHL